MQSRRSFLSSISPLWLLLPTCLHPISARDPHTVSRPDLVKTSHLHLDLEVDFARQMFSGTVVLTLERLEPNVSSLVLDVKNLTISTVRSEGKNLPYQILEENYLGDKLEIELGYDTGEVSISYSTSPSSPALQWLSPSQTVGGKSPYVFSQCQSINARALVPCQDTPSVKAPYTATITGPANLTVLMSALRDGQDTISGEKKVSKFVQAVSIPSYLLAIAIGAVKSRQLGPRSQVWAEQELLDQAADDFSDTEDMLRVAEHLAGPYVWERYDILVLPPFFPVGGMENPCLTFVTPTLLSGDKSNSFVIAHEIAHSWTGNLVTNINMEHFWLNEGFTVFLHRKILGRLNGELARHFEHELWWNKVEESIIANNLNPATNRFTALVTNLTGVGPEKAFSWVPYEKGSAFLWYLEEKLGGPQIFEPFLKAYIAHFAYQSIDTDDFKSFFLWYFQSNPAVTDIAWSEWLYTPGLPVKPDFNASLAEAARDLAKKWQLWQPHTEPDFQEEFSLLTSNQQQEFLNTLLSSEEALAGATVQRLDDLYQLSSSTNYYLRVPFIRLGLRSRWEPSVAAALKTVSQQGNLELTVPVYRAVFLWPEKRRQGLDTFLANREKYMGLVGSDIMRAYRRTRTQTGRGSL